MKMMLDYDNDLINEEKLKDNIISENKEYILTLEATLYKKSQDYDKLYNDYNNLYNKYNIILNSKSWKITRPFRDFMNFFRRKFK